MQTSIITVKGKVQGVSYRETTREQAEALGITGTVQNLPNGDVEIVATGTAEQLSALEAWCHRGPVMAEVDSVFISNVPFAAFENFRVIRR